MEIVKLPTKKEAALPSIAERLRSLADEVELAVECGSNIVDAVCIIGTDDDLDIRAYSSDRPITAADGYLMLGQAMRRLEDGDGD